MFGKIFRLSHKSLKHVFEASAFALVLVLLAIFAFAIRLSQAPVDLGFAKTYIVGALSDPDAGVSVDMKDIKLSWPKLGEEIVLDLSKASVRATSGARLSVDRMKVGVAQAPLLIGLIRPQTITLVEPKLRFTRKNGVPADVKAENDAENDNAVLNFIGASIMDTQQGRETVFTRLRQVTIQDANIRYKDLQAGWFLNLFKADVSFARTGNNLIYRLSVPGGIVENQGHFDETIVLDSMVIEGQYDPQAKQLLIDTPSGKIANLPLKIQGLFDLKKNGFDGTLSLVLDKIETDRLDELWPKGLQQSSGYEWLVTKLSKGFITDTKASVPLGFEIREDGFSLRVGFPEVTFAYEGLSVDYRPPLQQYTNAKGTGVYKNDNLELLAEGGSIGPLNVVKSRVYLDRLDETGVGDADIDVTLSGNLKDVFEYAKQDPINLDEKFKVNSAGIKGTGTYEVAINFPAIPELLAEQVKVDVAAKGQGVTIPDITDGLALEDAKIELVGKGSMLNVKGSGKVLGRDVILNWTRAMEPVPGDPIKSKIKLNVSSDDVLRKAVGAELEEVKGVMPLDLDIVERQDGTSTIHFKGNLTPATIDIPALGYNKVPGVSGSVQGVMSLKNDKLEQIKNTTVKATDLTLDGIVLNYGLDAKGEAILKSGTIANIKTGETTLKADFTKPTPTSYKIVASGPRVDMRPFFKSAQTNTTAGDSVSLKLTAPTAIGGEKEVLSNLSLDIDMNEFGTTTGLNLQARIGNGVTTVLYRPSAATPEKFKISAADAGAMLRAFDIYPNVLGGTLEIFADSVQPGSRDLKGLLTMRDFRVVRAPFLARLIGALSLQGLDQTLQGKEGLPFAKLQSEFELYPNEKGTIYAFRDGRTSGSSLGLTFEGKVDQSTKSVDFSGTIVPISEVNSFVTNIPVLGEILAGKKGSGVFAATYSLRGPSDNPSTLVNPLAVLTPGILRKILFERDVKMPSEKKTAPVKSKRNE